MHSLKRAFIAGLLFIVPVSLSFWILFRTMVFFENILGAFLKKYLPAFYTPGIGFFLLILIILFIGFLADNFFGKKMLSMLEKFFETLPLLNKIYMFIKGISQSIFHGKRSAFREPVKIEFFSGTYTIGFITGQSNMKGLVSVFVPTVPNISTGFYLLVPENKIEKLDMSVEEALKTVISMGIFGPENGSDKDRSDSS
ncbi:MAG TPA: DUF502 domain-containing protein [bacterium]|nr:DUF502 domain-containing protein [bacterium]